MRRRARRLLVPLSLAALLIPAASADAGKNKKKLPNLQVSAVSEPPEALVEGTELTVTDTTVNKGKKTAKPSATRYYLTKNPAASLAARKSSKTDPRTSFTDILLTGSREVPELAKGASSGASAPVQVQVPGGTPAGTYFLLACADDRGDVKEKPEDDNCKASNGSEAVGAPPTGLGRVDAFTDTALPVNPLIEPVITQVLQGFACGGTVAPKELTLDKAIADARGYLAQTAGADAMSAFAASPAYQSADAAEDAAGEAVLANKPGAALAALLRAHDLEPKEASHLVNAGGVAASIGRPNEAIAFLDAALRLDDPDAPAMGISRQAVGLASRGYAEMQRGRYEPAATALQAAIAIEPLLTEAQATLAGVQACQGQNPIAAFKKGRRRQDRTPPIDDSLGEETDMRNLPLPATARNAYSSEDYYLSLTQANETAETQVLQRIAQLEGQLNAVTPNISRVRSGDLRAMIYEASQKADLTALRQEINGLVGPQGDAEDAWSPIFGAQGNGSAGKYVQWINEIGPICSGDPDPNCSTREMRIRCIPEVQQAHGAWLVAMDSAVAKSRQWIKTYSKRVSAIGSNFANEDGEELARKYIELNEILLFEAIAQQAHTWAGILELQTDDGGVALCVQSPDPPGYTPPAPSPPQSAGPCPDELKGVSLTVSFGPLNVAANCEELTVSGSTPGWVSAFGEVTLNAREGTVSVFGGAKGEVGLGPLSGDFKSGAYVKLGSDGPRDAGWRVGPSYTVGAGPAQFGGSDTMDLSIVGALGSAHL